MHKNISIIYMGTNNFSRYVLNSLIANGYNIVGLVCQEDSEVGRKRILTPPPTKLLALEHGIEVFQPTSIRKDYSFIVNKKPDLIITCAYGQIIPQEVLDIPPYKCLNVHGSLLPKLRGAAPIQYAIIQDYQETGITIMEMVKKMDAGGMYTKASIKIENDDSGDSLFSKLEKVAAQLLLDTLPKYLNNELVKEEQNEEDVTFAPSFKKEDEHLNFNDKRRNIYNKIRALNSNPGAYALLDNEIIKIYESNEIENKYEGINGQIVQINKDSIIVKVSDGAIALKKIQPSSKRVMSVKEYLNGKKNLLGKVFL